MNSSLIHTLVPSADGADVANLCAQEQAEATLDPALKALLRSNPKLLDDKSALVASAEQVIVHWDQSDPWALAGAAHDLPPGYYRAPQLSPSARQVASWALAQYNFKAWGKETFLADKAKILVVDDPSILREAQSIVSATSLVRDLINRPANDLGPVELTDAALELAVLHKCEATVHRGESLAQDFPAVWSVGKASTTTRQPRVVDFTWGQHGPTITLVGKGVCYDTGGLNLKPGQFMRNMKKDMGGAAHALGLAHLIMSANLPVRLRVILGVVENSMGADSFRPGDVIHSRKGSTIEIGNTDAEGRLVLADCLTLAQEGDSARPGLPDLLVDFATLTGAARVALGTAMPAVFSNDQALANRLVQLGETVQDPLWSLPLYRPYAKRLKSPVADLGNIAEGERYGDAIIAALFLDHFVDPKIPWLHLDCFAWNTSDQAGRPKGGEAQGILACFELIKDRLARA